MNLGFVALIVYGIAIGVSTPIITIAMVKGKKGHNNNVLNICFIICIILSILSTLISVILLLIWSEIFKDRKTAGDQAALFLVVLVAILLGAVVTFCIVASPTFIINKVKESKDYKKYKPLKLKR